MLEYFLVRTAVGRTAVCFTAGFLALTLLLSAGCDRAPERGWERGEFHPEPGRYWDLPAGLSVNSLVGWEDELPSSLLPLALVLQNSSDRRQSVTMPAGLCFKPRDPFYQYMILLHDFSFTAPVGDTVVLLPTWCANELLDEPWEESFYDTDLQAIDVELKELFDLLQGKTIDDNRFDIYLLQEALWEITDWDGLTDPTREWLGQLP